MNTPFQWVKQVASHYGGTTNPMVISWPDKIPAAQHGKLRHQWHHVIDVVSAFGFALLSCILFHLFSSFLCSTQPTHPFPKHRLPPFWRPWPSLLLPW